MVRHVEVESVFVLVLEKLAASALALVRDLLAGAHVFLRISTHNALRAALGRVINARQLSSQALHLDVAGWPAFALVLATLTMFVVLHDRHCRPTASRL